MGERLDLCRRGPLIGEPVGVSETDSGDWLVRFANVDLGYIDLACPGLRAVPKLRICSTALARRRQLHRYHNHRLMDKDG
jgi:hypothetical protein